MENKKQVYVILLILLCLVCLTTNVRAKRTNSFSQVVGDSLKISNESDSIITKNYSYKGRIFAKNVFRNSSLIKHIFYYKDGNISYEVNFFEGYLNGFCTTYYKKGGIKSRVLFDYGKIISPMQVYRKNGNLKETYIVNDKDLSIFTELYKYNSKGNLKVVEEIATRHFTYFIYLDYYDILPSSE